MAEAHIYIYDEIGPGGITAKQIQKQVNDASGKRIMLHFDSPGGDVYEGYAIYNILHNSGKEINATIVGMCASIATLIACSAKKIVMLPLSQWLVHPPMSGIQGRAEDLRTAADTLDKIENTILDIYVQRTGKAREEIKALMAKDTFLSASEAHAMGFVDEVKERIKAVAYYAPNNSIDDMKDNEEIKAKMGVIEGMFAKIMSFMKPKNVDVKTKDGKTLVFDPAVEEGATVTQDGAPASDGDITLEDGKIVTIASGLVTKVTTPAEGDGADEVSALKAKIAELEAANAKAKADIAATIIEKTDIQNKFTESMTAVNALKVEMDELKAMTVGDTKPPRAGKQNFGGSGSGSVWDEVAKQAKSK